MSNNNDSRAMRANRLLAALPESEFERLLPDLKLVDLASGQVIYQPGEPITQVYFPHWAIISLILDMENGSTVEVGMVGNDGMTGIPVILGGNTTTTTAMVEVPDIATRINADVLKTEFNRGGMLQNILLRYVQVLYSQVAQTAACNRMHALEERLARWLLLVSEGVQSDDLLLTQEFIAQMLGVRRSGVTVAANALSQSGIISYNRGRINILNRDGLEAASCECYQAIKRESERLLGKPNPR